MPTSDPGGTLYWNLGHSCRYYKLTPIFALTDVLKIRIIPPAKAHAIYSLEKSIASLQLWYQADTLPLTEMSNKLDSPLAPHQSKPDLQPSLTAIAQAALDEGYENIDTAALQALCRLLHAPRMEDATEEDFGDVVVLEDSDADDAEEPDYSYDPDSSGITREILGKAELLKRLESDVRFLSMPLMPH